VTRKEIAKKANAKSWGDVKTAYKEGTLDEEATVMYKELAKVYDVDYSCVKEAKFKLPIPSALASVDM